LALTVANRGGLTAATLACLAAVVVLVLTALLGASASAALADGSAPSSRSPIRIQSVPASPRSGGVASASVGVAACSGPTVVLLLLIATVLPVVGGRLGKSPPTRLSAPFELTLQRSG
jgi:hypothetical protein